RAMPLDGLLAAAARDLRRPLAEVADEARHALVPPLELLGALHLGGENRHGEQTIRRRALQQLPFPAGLPARGRGRVLRAAAPPPAARARGRRVLLLLRV